MVGKDDKETIISAIKIVSEMEDTEVLVKPHTRGMILRNLCLQMLRF